MGPLLHMPSVVDQNIVVWHMIVVNYVWFPVCRSQRFFIKFLWTKMLKKIKIVLGGVLKWHYFFMSVAWKVYIRHITSETMLWGSELAGKWLKAIAISWKFGF